MNLGLEYLIRCDLIKSFIKFPCSLFLNKGKEKLVITLSKEKSYNLTYWRLRSDLFNNQILSSYKITTENLSIPFIPFGFKTLRYQEQPISTRENSWRRPMYEYVYNKYYNLYLNSQNHKIVREIWLWRAFTSVYGLNLKYFMPQEDLIIGSEMRSAQEQIIVEDLFPKKWYYWKKWQKNMYFDTPAELFFR